mgnify:CR=1 FL=1
MSGVQNIITAYKKNKEKRPLCLRFIGNITDPADMPKGDLMIDTAKAGITVEGIGTDTVFNGFGLVMKNCSNVEVRNIGFMNCNSSEGDDCGLQQGNDHIWCITVISSMVMPVQMPIRSRATVHWTPRLPPM